MPATGIVHENQTLERGYQLPHPENVPYYDIQRVAAALAGIDADMAAVLEQMADILAALGQKTGQEALDALEGKLLGGAGPAIDTLKELANLIAANDTDIAAFTAALAGKAALSHGHGMTDVGGLQTALDGKAPLSHSHNYAAASHGHAIADVAGLQAIIDAIGAGLTQADLDALEAKLLGGAGPAIDTLKELANLIADNDSDIAVFTAALAGKAAASHGHGITDVSGLQAALDGKAASSHNHNSAYLAVNGTAANAAALGGVQAAALLTAEGNLRTTDKRGAVPGTDLGEAGVRFDFITCSEVGINDGGTYGRLMTFQGWQDNSGGNSNQLLFSDSGALYLRGGIPGSAWGAWTNITATWGGARKTVSTSAPSGGVDGDIWFVRSA